MAPQRVIIDTDPGVDDILALLLALSSKPEELEVLLISVTFGNVNVQNCLLNVISLFHIIEKEQGWRRANSRPEGFDTLKACRPVVAVGAEKPLSDQIMLADFYHGVDGLGGIHSSHPHLNPTETWKSLFDPSSNPTSSSKVLTSPEANGSPKTPKNFVPSRQPGHKEMLRILAESPENTITIIVIGPLTTVALAAAEDPKTFLRVKEVVVMGGAINVPGNMTPLAEFNTHADAVAAARVFALTSPNPSSAMPPPPASPSSSSLTSTLPTYPLSLPTSLSLTLFPLDITTTHLLTAAIFDAATASLRDQGSPLAEWTAAFLPAIFSRSPEGVSLHDPLCVWYTQRHYDATLEAAWHVSEPQDIRVEALGQWTRGACIVDRRGRVKRKRELKLNSDGGALEDVAGDLGGWLTEGRGTAIRVCVASPDSTGTTFGKSLLERVFGL